MYLIPDLEPDLRSGTRSPSLWSASWRVQREGSQKVWVSIAEDAQEEVICQKRKQTNGQTLDNLTPHAALGPYEARRALWSPTGPHWRLVGPHGRRMDTMGGPMGPKWPKGAHGHPGPRAWDQWTRTGSQGPRPRAWDQWTRAQGPDQWTRARDQWTRVQGLGPVYKLARAKRGKSR